MAHPDRILLLCNSYPPEIGAAPLRMRGMAHLLRDAGYEVGVLAGMPNYPTGRIFPEYRKASALLTETIEGIMVFRLPFAPSNSANRIRRTGSLFSLSGALLRYGSAVIDYFYPNQMIISSPPLPLALCGAWLARRHSIPFLLNISDLWPLTALELGALREGPLYKSLERVESWLFSRARGFIGQSDEILRYIGTRKPITKPSFLYRNLLPGIAPEAVCLPSGSGSRRIVYAGLIGPVQGILEIATQVDFGAHGMELHIYGDGADREALEAFVRKHPGRGVFYKGLISPEEMFRKLPQYDFALASLRTALYGAVPSKIYAALASGLPVVFMGDGEGAALIRQHRIGWTLPAGSPTALEAQLPLLRSMPAADLLRMRHHIVQLQQSHFHYQQQGKSFLEFLQEMENRWE